MGYIGFRGYKNVESLVHDQEQVFISHISDLCRPPPIPHIQKS